MWFQCSVGGISLAEQQARCQLIAAAAEEALAALAASDWSPPAPLPALQALSNTDEPFSLDDVATG